MDSFWEALITIVQSNWGALVIFVVMSPWWLWGVVWCWKGLQWRRAYEDFAAAHHLQISGTTPDPRTSRVVRGAALLWKVLYGTNVIEGQWDGLPIRVFDMAGSRNNLGQTTVFATVDGMLVRGARAERTIAASPSPKPVLIRTETDILSVMVRPQIPAADLATWLSFATQLARAMEEDGKDAFPRAGGETPPPPTRPMFGMFRQA